MPAKHFITLSAIAAATFLGNSAAIGSITIPTVLVGNPGNPADGTTGTGHSGSVEYAYYIGTTEVTNEQYVAFLNAVAATDTNNLYYQSMSSEPYGGITRSGAAGSYTYATISGRANHPVNQVNFWNAIRFANWLHNGQPTGAQDESTTENGAYTLTAAGIAANSITRNAGAIWAVPSADEWYKAAYYQPSNQGGDYDNYWRYPVMSNTITTAMANYRATGLVKVTPVGSYPPNFYGAFDMGGNMWEWIEGIYGPNNTSRGIAGGSFQWDAGSLRADFFPQNYAPIQRGEGQGFRVVQLVVCLADVNHDNVVDLSDFFAFFNCFDQTQPCADITGDGEIDLNDFFAFFNAFDQSC